MREEEEEDNERGEGEKQEVCWMRAEMMVLAVCRWGLAAAGDDSRADSDSCSRWSTFCSELSSRCSCDEKCGTMRRLPG